MNESKTAFVAYIAMIITVGCVLVVGALLAPRPNYSNQVSVSPHSVNQPE
jgi:hypothetical protein